ncbi:MAG: hypothetical protein LBS56_00340 [Propionibacteriaceae bacterium]|jgi:hypothetical protein|nr:hypothetical protein [Propionibacteriaceae bacterium]
MTTVYATTGADLTKAQTKALFDSLVQAVEAAVPAAGVILDPLGPDAYAGSAPVRLSAVVVEDSLGSPHREALTAAVTSGARATLGDVPVDVFFKLHDPGSYAVDGVLARDA